MAKVVHLNEEVDAQRELLKRLSDMPDKSLDEIQADFFAHMKEIDPELADMMKESAEISGQACMAAFRYNGYDISGTDFEKRRDERAYSKEQILDRKIDAKLGHMQ